MEVKVKERQSLLDIALQTSGGMAAAWGLAAINDTSLTAVLSDDLPLRTAPVEHPYTVNRYHVEKIYPATALSREEETALTQEGIHFMGIEIDFIIS